MEKQPTTYPQVTSATGGIPMGPTGATSPHLSPSQSPGPPQYAQPIQGSLYQEGQPHLAQQQHFQYSQHAQSPPPHNTYEQRGGPNMTEHQQYQQYQQHQQPYQQQYQQTPQQHQTIPVGGQQQYHQAPQQQQTTPVAGQPQQQQQQYHQTPQQQQATPIGTQQQYMSATPLSSLGMSPSPVDCPMCHQRRLTNTTYVVGNTTHLWALVTCLLTLCLCFIPYMVNSLKDVQHRCGNCGVHLATWHKSGQVDVHTHM